MDGAQLRALCGRRVLLYADAEHRGDSNFDIVLVGSDSFETVKLTHASYLASSDGDLPKRFGERSRRSAPGSEATQA